jgi:hypothetical protein
LLIGRSLAGLGEGVDRCLVSLGEAVEVLLGGDDRGVPETFLDDLEVRATGQKPGGVSMAEVVDPRLEPQVGGAERRGPDVTPERVARDVGIVIEHARLAG